ncbi:hypothetical protein TgHK011_001529 [Trichoderma gracile]|nr:hypothetical protein TgHK011_001529 [Trichoderma gracile]
MAHLLGASSSKLGKDGYDFVVATTQASINSGLKEFLAEDNQPVRYLCFLMNPNNTVDKIVDREEIKELTGVDPFDLSAGTDYWDERVQTLYRHKFSIGFKMRMGLPRNVLPKDLPDIVELRDEANNVVFRTMCSEFIIHQLQPPVWGEGSWNVFDQSDTVGGKAQIWTFTTNVDLVRKNLDETLDTEYFNNHPEEREALLEKLRNISGTAYSLQQLLLELDSAVLQSSPEIDGLPEEAMSLLNTYFKTSYAKMAKEHGWPLLGITAVAHETDPSQLQLTDFDRQVTKHSSLAKASTLDNVCAANGRRLPPKYNFNWNWVDSANINDMSGVISINRHTMANFFLDQLLDKIKPACIEVDATVRARWNGNIEFKLRVGGGRNPMRNIFTDGTTVGEFRYESSTWDDDKYMRYYGHMGVRSVYTASLVFVGKAAKVIQESQVDMDVQALNERVEFKMWHTVLTDTYELWVDQGGTLRLTAEGETQREDKSDPIPDPGFWGRLMGLDDMLERFKSWFSRVIEAKLDDAPLNGAPDFVYPGSRVFTYREASFSNHQDLVASLTYVSPASKGGRSTLGSALGLKIDHSSELMQNYIQGEIVSPTGKFQALQTRNKNGHALLFSVDSSGAFLVIKEDSGTTSTGWQVIDLSNDTRKQYISRGSDISTAPGVRTFGVGQSALDGTISLAMAIDSNGTDDLYLSLGNNGAETSWLNYVQWVPVPFDERSLYGQPIRIANIMFAETFDNTQYIIVDVDTTPRSRTQEIVRYHIDLEQSTGKIWVRHELPIDIEKSSYQSAVGRRANGRVDGVYTAGQAGGGAQLIYQPIINIFGEGPPLPIRFNLPGNTIPSAIATVRRTDSSDSKLYGATDLYTASEAKLFRFPAEKQKDNAEGEEVLSNPIFSGTSILHGMDVGGVTTIWGKNSSNEVFYVACLSDEVADPDSWSAPVPVVNGVELMSAYVNNMDGGNTIFTAGGGQLKKLTQASNTHTKVWRWQDIRLASTPQQPVTAFKSYTTTIHLKGDDGKPAADTKLSLWADSHTPVYINGLYYVLGKTAINIPTDSAGNITVIEASPDMNASVLSVSIPHDTESIVINPMDTAFYKLSALDTTQKLKDADYPANTVAGGIIGHVERKKLVDPSTSNGDLDTVARSMDSLKEVWNNVRPPSKTRKLYFDNDGPLVIPARGLRHGSAAVGEVSGLDDIWMAAGDLFNWLKSGVKALVKIIKDAVTGAWQFVAEIAGKVYKAVLNAADAVIGAIEWVFEQIKTAVEDLIRFIEFLFQWDDITRTKKVLHNMLKLYMKHQVSQLDAARVAFNEKADEAAETLAAWGGITNWSSLGSVAEKPAVDSAEDPAEGHDSGSLLFAHHFQNQAAHIEVKPVVPQISAEAAELIDVLLNAINEEGEVLSGVYHELQTLASQFVSLNVGDIIKGLAAILAKGLLSSVKVVVDALFRVLASLSDSAVELLDAKIHIPVISDILNAIGFPDISLLDLFTWIAAVGYTVAYKAINNEPPFPDSSEINALIGAGSWDDLQGIVKGTSIADEWTNSSDKEPLDSLNALQKLLHVSGHAVTGFLLLVTNYTGILEASFLTGDNPFGNALSVVGFATAGTQLTTSNLAPRHSIENKVVNDISYATSAFTLLNQVAFSGPIQDRLAMSHSRFAGLAADDGRATAAIIDSIMVIPALFVTGWHFYELSGKEVSMERSAAILDEVTNLTSYISRISYTVAVNDKDPITKPIPLVVMGAANLIGAGLQVAAAPLAN